jgi:hypothetical protein
LSPSWAGHAATAAKAMAVATSPRTNFIIFPSDEVQTGYRTLARAAFSTLE